MRIAVSGTHFIGKTTLIEKFIKAHSDYRCEIEPYYKLQDENVSTCGRHVVLRLWNKHLNADEYANRLIKLAQVSKKPIDVVVSILTQNSLIKK